MKAAVEKEGMKIHWMCQPVGYRTADGGRDGFASIPECALGMSIICNNNRG